MQTERILWAVKTGDPDYAESVITSTTDPARIAAARAWAESNGFDRFRESTYSGEAPDFTATINI